jgi:DNA helicase-2/ATP-dependent DNA helicase PcrA
MNNEGDSRLLINYLKKQEKNYMKSGTTAPARESIARNILQEISGSPAQLKAAVSREKCVLVSAGAGAGKTRVLTARTCWLINEGVPGSSILALTFTNDAAAEMKERVFAQLNSLGLNDVEKPTIATFHSWSSKILFGAGEKYRLLDNEAANKVWFKANGRSRNRERQQIDFLKSMGCPDAATYAKSGNTEDRILEAWSNYDAVMQKGKIRQIDFNDLLIIFAEKLSNPQFRTAIQKRYSCLLVDEFQDLNPIQHEIIRLFADGHPNLKSLWVCGDERQTIYEFRGSVVGSFERFLKDYGAQHCELRENWRNQSNIVTVADNIIANNVTGLKSAMIARKASELPVVLFKANNDETERIFVLEQTRLALSRGEQIFILGRDNKSLDEMKDFLEQNNVNTSRKSQEAWRQSAEIGKIVSLFRAAINPHQNPESLRELVPVTLYATLESAERLAARQQFSLWEAMCRLAKSDEGLLSIVSNVAAVSDRLWRGQYALGFCEALDRSGWMSSITKSLKTTQSMIEVGVRLEEITRQLNELKDKISPNELPEIVWNAFRQTPSEAGTDLLTVHGSKGLQRKTVIIIGLDRFQAETAEELESERRLLYVGLTRAESHLFVTGKECLFFNELSEAGAKFLEEISH